MNDDEFLQRIAITLEIPGGPGTETIATQAFLDILRHLEHDGIQPFWTTLEITGPATP